MNDRDLILGNRSRFSQIELNLWKKWWDLSNDSSSNTLYELFFHVARRTHASWIPKDLQPLWNQAILQHPRGSAFLTRLLVDHFKARWDPPTFTEHTLAILALPPAQLHEACACLGAVLGRTYFNTIDAKTLRYLEGVWGKQNTYFAIDSGALFNLDSMVLNPERNKTPFDWLIEGWRWMGGICSTTGHSTFSRARWTLDRNLSKHCIDTRESLHAPVLKILTLRFPEWKLSKHLSWKFNEDPSL